MNSPTVFLGEQMRQNGWEKSAACAPENRTETNKGLDWFTNDKDQKYKARATCQGQCPVRKKCLQFALDNQMLHGIWGGVDDYEIRRAMSVDAVGDPRQRNRTPRCPYCMSRKLDIAGQKTKKGYQTKCTECNLLWYMATIPPKLKTKKTAT